MGGLACWHKYEVKGPRIATARPVFRLSAKVIWLALHVRHHPGGL